MLPLKSLPSILLYQLLCMQLSLGVARVATGQTVEGPAIPPASRFIGAAPRERATKATWSKPPAIVSLPAIPQSVRQTLPSQPTPQTQSAAASPMLRYSAPQAGLRNTQQFPVLPTSGFASVPIQSAIQTTQLPTVLNPWNGLPDTGVPARYVGQRRSFDSQDFSALALPTTKQDGDKQTAAPGHTQGQGEELPAPAPRRDGGGKSGFDPLSALPPSMLGGKQPATKSTANDTPAAREAANKAKEEKQPADQKDEEDLKYSGKPTFYSSAGPYFPQQIDAAMQPAAYDPGAFAPGPQIRSNTPPHAEIDVYRRKRPVPTQRPFFELWRPQYTGGIYPEPKLWLGEYNPMVPHLIGFGDIRTGVGINQLSDRDAFSVASQLNLNIDLKLTATERIHAFMGPFDNGTQSSRLDFSDDFNVITHTDLTFDSLFFEGDVGAIVGGLNGHPSTFDLPFSFGLLPLFYQNGIWAADNVIGGAVALPARHSRLLKWSNFDASLFFALDQVNSDAFAGDNNAAEIFGSSWFIDAYDGHIEVNYAYVHDGRGEHRSYHNFGIGFTRRYFHRISNSIRFITNFNQSLNPEDRTADGHLLLFENSLISTQPNTFVPYLNLFYGQGRTQSLARAAAAGGVLVNTGINFASDALTDYPTLDATGVNTAGGALGFNLLGDDFSKQLVVEAAAVGALGQARFRNAAGNQLGVGIRYQQALNNFTIFRTDHMYGFLQNDNDITGSRVELRWKF